VAVAPKGKKNICNTFWIRLHMQVYKPYKINVKKVKVKLSV
jgi:hypothetical protein